MCGMAESLPCPIHQAFWRRRAGNGSVTGRRAAVSSLVFIILVDVADAKLVEGLERFLFDGTVRTAPEGSTIAVRRRNDVALGRQRVPEIGVRHRQSRVEPEGVGRVGN